MAQKVFREIFTQGFWMIWKYKLEKDGLIYKMLSFLSLISLVCLVFRNEEMVVFIAIMLSCILLDFQSINLLSLKTFLFKNFQIQISFSLLIEQYIKKIEERNKTRRQQSIQEKSEKEKKISYINPSFLKLIFSYH